MDLDHDLDEASISLGADLANALLALSEGMAALAEAVDACRADALARGYSESAAEMMALEYHRFVMTMLSQARSS